MKIEPNPHGDYWVFFPLRSSLLRIAVTDDEVQELYDLIDRVDSQITADNEDESFVAKGLAWEVHYVAPTYMVDLLGECNLELKPSQMEALVACIEDLGFV